ncbi:hypothetical protein [Pseudomonas sp. B21-047]|uniref:hypothetical protein n=1 Tax=Pseudomonas sp. B21-047 TaxID=2895489 RepID=UPI00215E5614|nr:hypothetical protein [Pseudomonas sp. B21-047]UVL05964.1 hypothetical protein LOY26_10665 [Pseudomonas sp. B21-047]
MSGEASVSGIAKAISQFSDPYERQARLYPALLALSPMIVTVVALYGDKLGLISGIVSLLIVLGGLFMLSDYARSRGKAKEQALWQKWGGAPSTQVLRHRNGTFERGELLGYHSKLATQLGRPFPSSAEEASDSQRADEVYAEACGMLRGATRDTKKFKLLFKDNISYGFRRNALGLRKVAVASAIFSLIWVAVRQGPSMWVSRYQEATTPEAFFSVGEVTAIGASLVMLLIWTTYITEKSVRDAAFSYARTLVSASGLLAAKPKASRAKKEKVK